MPKILINEIDQTFPGTPGAYSNFAVLITGFEKGIKNPTVKPDSNNVYEFTSTQAFVDTIGCLPPKMEKTTGNGSITFKHYGNQMAYELLKLGYPVIYKSLGNLAEDYTTTKDVVDTITSEDLWAPFKDKASYDFRFVTHGLLSSSRDSLETNQEYQEATRKKAILEEALGVLNSIKKDVDDLEELANQEANTDFERESELLARYNEVADNYEGFIEKNNTPYATYAEAVIGVTTKLAEVIVTIENIECSGLTSGDINKVNGHIANLAKYVVVENPTNKTVYGRGDCIALIELDEKTYTTKKGSINRPEDLIIQGIKGMSGTITAENGTYCALTVPSVVYKMSENTEYDDNKVFPGAFHYLACFLNSIRLGFAEWYAVAGYTRGVSSYVIDHTTVKLGEIAINALEPRYIIDQEVDPQFACNVIANFRGSYYLWGNRTAHQLGAKGNAETGDLVARHFLNIRHLCTTIKKQLYIACRTFTFDPNSDTLWVNFCNAIRPTLDAMKADQGIRDYKILKITDNVPKATLKAKIRIIPIEAVEDFDLEIFLEDSFGETAAAVIE